MVAEDKRSKEDTKFRRPASPRLQVPIKVNGKVINVTNKTKDLSIDLRTKSPRYREVIVRDGDCKVDLSKLKKKNKPIVHGKGPMEPKSIPPETNQRLPTKKARSTEQTNKREISNVRGVKSLDKRKRGFTTNPEEVVSMGTYRASKDKKRDERSDPEEEEESAIDEVMHPSFKTKKETKIEIKKKHEEPESEVETKSEIPAKRVIVRRHSPVDVVPVVREPTPIVTKKSVKEPSPKVISKAVRSPEAPVIPKEKAATKVGSSVPKVLVHDKSNTKLKKVRSPSPPKVMLKDPTPTPKPKREFIQRKEIEESLYFSPARRVKQEIVSQINDVSKSLHNKIVASVSKIMNPNTSNDKNTKDETQVTQDTQDAEPQNVETSTQETQDAQAQGTHGDHVTLSGPITIQNIQTYVNQDTKKKKKNKHGIDFDNLTEQQVILHRDTLIARRKILQQKLPTFDIKDVDPNNTLEFEYDRQYNYRSMHYSRLVCYPKYRLYLIVIWGAIECIFIALDINIKGFTIERLREMNEYDIYLLGMGEKEFDDVKGKVNPIMSIVKSSAFALGTSLFIYFMAKLVGIERTVVDTFIEKFKAELKKADEQDTEYIKTKKNEITENQAAEQQGPLSTIEETVANAGGKLHAFIKNNEPTQPIAEPVIKGPKRRQKKT